MECEATWDWSHCSFWGENGTWRRQEKTNWLHWNRHISTAVDLNQFRSSLNESWRKYLSRVYHIITESRNLLFQICPKKQINDFYEIVSIDHRVSYLLDKCELKNEPGIYCSQKKGLSKSAWYFTLSSKLECLFFIRIRTFSYYWRQNTGPVLSKLLSTF